MGNIIAMSPRWASTLLERTKGGYNYTLLCPLQPHNKVTGWRRGKKSDVQKMLSEVVKRLNTTVFKLPKHLQSSVNVAAHKKRLSDYAKMDKDRKGR